MQTQEYFRNYCLKKGLKSSKIRDIIVDTFLTTEEHISAYDLYNIIRKDKQLVGFSTVYRTLKLLVDAGIAREVNFGSETHFEHLFGHKHHDHFVCQQCGKVIEFHSKKIEQIQNNLAVKYRFLPTKHSLIIYGFCKECYRDENYSID